MSITSEKDAFFEKNEKILTFWTNLLYLQLNKINTDYPEGFMVTFRFLTKKFPENYPLNIF
ncbi:hypothetical protein SAMN03080598_01223 [Algoriphagus boritolerans DSM 17298 = JCM 18970]|uniref:Uncharacterized protein n=1 Tax=Algoriphagus boritolerans DSM 17298 = JCM 18970 TaxID=1120964 RepID=A0A1H5UGE7_9BACT|nr:hypothetical protein SAMN03080598_01223 [Algoriphagus boritolerans DSM 17298 = JCM 18970]